MLVSFRRGLGTFLKYIFFSADTSHIAVRDHHVSTDICHAATESTARILSVGMNTRTVFKNLNNLLDRQGYAAKNANKGQ